MFPEEALSEVFALLARVAEAVAATVGPTCEAVVHDLRRPEHSVVAISGSLTRRQVGSPVPDPELLPGKVDRFSQDQLLYRTVTPFGKELLSSTVWVRDAANHIVGALCINMDFADLRLARDLIQRAIVDPPAAGQGLATFATSPEEFGAMALRGALHEIGKPPQLLTREERIRVVCQLDQAGVFNLRHAAEAVAAELGVSRASVYSYLKDARAATTTAT